MSNRKLPLRAAMDFVDILEGDGPFPMDWIMACARVKHPNRRTKTGLAEYMAQKGFNEYQTSWRGHTCLGFDRGNVTEARLNKERIR